MSDEHTEHSDADPFIGEADVIGLYAGPFVAETDVMGPYHPDAAAMASKATACDPGSGPIRIDD
jgi:hypothetical protein